VHACLIQAIELGFPRTLGATVDTLRYLIQRRSDVPAALGFLTDFEAAAREALATPSRRDDFTLGRWTIKRAVFACLRGAALSFADIEVRPTPSGAPAVLLDGAPAPLSVSLSHRAGEALCCVAPARLAMGCDLEIVEPHSAAFVADFFAPEERSRWERAALEDRDLFAALTWSAKESALKALREGLRRDTRSAIVAIGDLGPRGRWSPLSVRLEEGDVLAGLWRRDGARLATLVTFGATAPPEPLA